MVGQLILQDGSTFEGKSFGSSVNTAGEVVFSTGMVGYTESLTDPSYCGQLLVLTYPLIGNYGVPEKIYWESDSIKISGLIVSNYIDTPSHHQSKRSLGEWLKDENIPALEVTDTRYLTQKIRDNGTLLGKMIINSEKNNIDSKTQFYDPNKDNLVAKMSSKKILKEGRGNKTIILIDCGAKENIKRCLLKRGARVITVPWNCNPFKNNSHLGWRQAERKRSHDSSEVEHFDAIVISNGPGNPKMADKTIEIVKKALDKKIPILGVCLGHQILALAAGGNTTKLKFGHRSQNQPCLQEDTNRCYITSQNHGFAVSKIPPLFKTWFINANDRSNEGIIHEKYPFMSVQFHPEAAPGPVDTEWIFDYFLEMIKL